MGGLFFAILVPLSTLIATLVIRWIVNRPDPGDGHPVSPEDLNREKPEVTVVDISYEYLDPVLESIEDTIDWGISPSQRESLVERIDKLVQEGVTSAIFPIQYMSVTSDLLMHFMRIDQDIVRCRFEGTPVIVGKVKSLLTKVPLKTQVF